MGKDFYLEQIRGLGKQYRWYRKLWCYFRRHDESRPDFLLDQPVDHLHPIDIGQEQFHEDSQSVKTTESGDVHGYDAGKKIKGRKRHIVTDTLGLLIGSLVDGAYIQDRDGAPDVLKSIRHAFPWLRHIFADAAYAGPKLRGALEEIGDWTVEIIKRSDSAKGFKVLLRRWVVERTFAWLGRCRRLAKDW